GNAPSAATAATANAHHGGPSSPRGSGPPCGPSPWSIRAPPGFADGSAPGDGAVSGPSGFDGSGSDGASGSGAHCGSMAPNTGALGVGSNVTHPSPSK